MLLNSKLAVTSRDAAHCHWSWVDDVTPGPHDRRSPWRKHQPFDNIIKLTQQQQQDCAQTAKTSANANISSNNDPGLESAFLD